MIKEDAVEKAKAIKFVIVDIHGVLTDNTLYYTDDGKKSECFSLHDRLGFKALMDSGIKVAFLTSKISRADEQMGKVYGIPQEFLWGSSAKMALLDEKQKELGFTDQDFCYIGDEMIDLGMMKRARLAVAPADASLEAKSVADIVTKVGGGKGVIRELAEFILKAQGKWDSFVKTIT
jgi:3-deoxy-D-manno-octulosonate 8-phosphate phosphatase (KDO 8-P phosphatase)